MEFIEGARLKDETGIALVFAIQIMSVMALMIAATLGSALSLGSTTQRDVGSKQALEGALSGLDQARYRVNQLAPATNMCVTSQAVATGTSGAATGECPAYTGDLGNGTTYGYTVTPTLTVGATCGGQTVTSTTGGQYRCMTAYGTSDGVTRRAQALVQGGTTSTALFPLNGLIALTEIRITENNWGDINGPMGSNTRLENKSCPSSSVNATWTPGPTATYASDNSCKSHTTVNSARSTPWALDPVDSKFTGTETTNDNATVFGSAAGFSYTAGNRTLKDTANATLIINGANPRTGSGGVWTFNFCDVDFTHVTSIKLQNGAVARLLIDDDSRSGSGCPAIAGNHLKMTNVAGINYDTATNTPGNPAALQIMQYGNALIEITNQSGISASLYAPDANVKFTNKTTWVGAIAANKIEATNGLDFTAGDVSSITGSSSASGVYARTTPGFVECKPVATATTDPESGC